MKLFKMMLRSLIFCDPVNEMKLSEVVKSRSRCPVNEMKPLKMIMPPLLAFCGAQSYLSYSALCPYQVSAGAIAELVQSPTASTTSLTLVLVGDRPQEITLICSLNTSRPFVAQLLDDPDPLLNHFLKVKPMLFFPSVSCRLVSPGYHLSHMSNHHEPCCPSPRPLGAASGCQLSRRLRYTPHTT